MSRPTDIYLRAKFVPNDGRVMAIYVFSKWHRRTLCSACPRFNLKACTPLIRTLLCHQESNPASSGCQSGSVHCGITNLVSRHHLRSASRRQLVVPRHGLSTFGRRAFAVAGPMSWNSLPNSLRESACDDNISEDCFKHSLKTFLFSEYWRTKRSGGVYDSAPYKCIFTYLLRPTYLLGHRDRPLLFSVGSDRLELLTLTFQMLTVRLLTTFTTPFSINQIYTLIDNKLIIVTYIY